MTVTAQATLPEAGEKLVQNAEAKPSVEAAVGSHDSILEPKYDGWRTVWRTDADGAARFWSRTGQELTGRMPAVEAEIARVFPPGSWIDGEVVAFEQTPAGVSVPKWGAVQSVLGSGVQKAALASSQLTLVVFDLLAHGGIDARALPFEKRRQLLEIVFEKSEFPTAVRLAPQFDATEENYEALVAAGYEGAVVKWLSAPYKSGARGAGWSKLKATATEDVIIVGFKPGENGFAGLVGALEFGQYDENGLLVHRGRCSGMDFDTRCAISKNPEAYVGKVFEMRHMGLTEPSKPHPLGAFRHPQFKKWRPDRTAESVTVNNGV
jgi:bifunctional non-homologous end joining protein LigD